MYIIVYTTTSDIDKARAISSYLVEKKLAACVNMHRISSIYTWGGKTEEGDEVALSIKTTSGNFEAVSEAIRSMHSYDLPAIISWEIGGDREYLDWISDSVVNK